MNREEVTEYAWKRRQERPVPSYDVIGYELTQKGVRRENGQPYTASHINLMVRTKYPEAYVHNRQRKVRSKKEKVEEAVVDTAAVKHNDTMKEIAIKYINMSTLNEKHALSHMIKGAT